MAPADLLAGDLYGVIELWVTLHQFINVQMQCQGWYAVRVRLAPSPHIKAVFPFLNKLDLEEYDGMLVDAEARALQPVEEKGWSWRSRVFNIKHVLESVDMLDPAPCFQVFVRDPASVESVTFIIQMELLAQTLEPQQDSVPFHPAKLKVVATEEVRLTGVHCHLLAYQPVSWGQHYMALAHVLMGSCLVGWATRASMHLMGQAVRRDLRQSNCARLGSCILTKGLPMHYREDAWPHPLSPTVSMDPFHLPPELWGLGATTSPQQGAKDGTQLASRSLSFSPFKTMVSTLQAPALEHEGPIYIAGSRTSTTTTATTLAEYLQVIMAPAFLTKSSNHAQRAPPPHQPHLPAAACDRLELLWRTLALPLLRGNAAVVTTLTQSLLASCYAPQTYQALRSLMVELPAMSHKAFQAAQCSADMSSGSPPQSTKTPCTGRLLGALRLPSARSPSTRRAGAVFGSVVSPPASQQQCVQATNSNGEPAPLSIHGVEADVASWKDIPPELVPALPPNCSPDGALLYLYVALTRLMHSASVECAVIQWLVRFTPHELVRALRGQWKGEQLALVAPWAKLESELQLRHTVTGQNVFRVCAVAQCAHLAAMQSAISFRQPQIARIKVWDAPQEQPMLYVDDSLATYLRDVLAGHMNHTPNPGLSDGQPSHGSRPSLPGECPSYGAGGLDPAGLSIQIPGEDSVAGTRMSSGSSGGDQGDAAQALSERDVHLMVFVHGFKGAPTDLDMVKAHVHMMCSSLQCRFSASNEERTSDSLESLGERLAEEVLGWARQVELDGKWLARLSFAAHSMGALIVRSALASPKMAELLPKLWLFLSIAGPHLGQLYSGNGLLSVGLGVLKVVQKGSLQQLDMSDAKDQDPSSAWLYRLATRTPGSGGSLQAFKRVVLVACEQDRYVPPHSAELSWCEAALKDRSWKGKAYADMLSASTVGFGASKGAPQLLRVAVHFPGLGASLLGRAAHLALVEHNEVARLLAWGVLHRFGVLGREGSIGAPAWC